MDQLVICEVSIKDNSIDCNHVNHGGVIDKSSIYDYVNQEELIEPDKIVTPAQGHKHLPVKKDKEDKTNTLNSYPDNLMLSCKKEFLFKEENPVSFDSEASETDSQPSEMEVQPISEEVYGKRTQAGATLMSSLQITKRSKLQDSDSKPGTSTQPTARGSKARIAKAPSSSTSAVSQDNQYDSDFGLQCSEDSSGLGPCGSQGGLFAQYLHNESYVTEKHGVDDDYKELQDLQSGSNDEHSRQTSEECGPDKISKQKSAGQTGRRRRRSRSGDCESSPNIITKIYFVCNGCNETFGQKQRFKVEKCSPTDKTSHGYNGEVSFFGNRSECNKVGADRDERFSSSGNLKEGVREELLICSECKQLFGKKITVNVVEPRSTGESSSGLDIRLAQTLTDEKSSDGDSRTTEHLSEDVPKTTSTQKRVYVCPECSEQFLGKRPLNKHMRTHTNQKPYVCPHCNQGFARKFTLNMHIRTHTREKPYECPECSKCFAISVNLRTHMKIHAGVKPYVCTECNRSFARKSHLDGHMQIHNGEKTFVCPSCGHKFFHKHNLIKHLRTHSKEQPFGCPECHERFSYKSHFKKHLRIHTGGAAWTGPIVKDQQGQV